MRNTLYTALLAGVVMPFAAFAQDATTPPPTDTPPAVEAPADATAPADSAAPAEGTDATTGDAAAPAEGEPMSRDDATTMPDSGAAPADTTAMDTATSTDATVTDGPFVVVPPTGAWRVEDLDGKDVYDTAGESIGSITDVLVSEQGEVIAVLVGVGGFLGIGRKDVAVAMDALEFGPGKTEGLPKKADIEAAAPAPVDPAVGGAATGVDPAAGGAAQPAPEPQTPVVGDDNLPDRIVLNVSREQLEAAPAYGEPEQAEAAEEAAPDAGMAPADGTTPAPQ
ncbi:PRC-barrel domain-containing protein [Aurantimonas sp. C2-6-R+9]|uniref:PRC-barrel domain-containing protein n=1 Tax=unclassified Aurantimonas TaxID=2638230 RepID=UPI002E16F00F|nr:MULTISPECIES: PRC-barrel domain-containing protein [unclassified Aurantimonas]MEC5292548.1 PRC-barrel domain-containing protein [Aurantimonas sp. C2-3-R2]MEC5382727.1 PRC-barrel domain-containing protein [Aurantimonas sp. C2-6-R+9]MEC5413557.1 PRC-barrel domain-containing protein [Aurantimonas sp. C2-4-R8]